jgi:hypothetical protein
MATDNSYFFAIHCLVAAPNNGNTAQDVNPLNVGGCVPVPMLPQHPCRAQQAPTSAVYISSSCRVFCSRFFFASMSIHRSVFGKYPHELMPVLIITIMHVLDFFPKKGSLNTWMRLLPRNGR